MKTTFGKDFKIDDYCSFGEVNSGELFSIFDDFKQIYIKRNEETFPPSIQLEGWQNAMRLSDGRIVSVNNNTSVLRIQNFTIVLE